MNNETQNLDINDYSVKELMDLLDITSLNTVSVNEKINENIQQFSEEGNEAMVEFFKKAKKKLLENIQSQIQQNWFENEYPLTEGQPIQNSKITSRFNKVQEFDGALQQERLAINQSRPVPYAQGEINPTLRNITTKIVNVDSRFRSNNVPALKSLPYTSTGIWNPTHFTADLSENLNKVMLLRLYSVHIPYTWYNIPRGSNCFMYDDVVYSLTPGNYDPDSLITEIAGLGIGLTLNYSSITGKVTLSGLSPNTQLVFFKTEGLEVGINVTEKCGGCDNNTTNQVNNTLGWILGFREVCYTIPDPAVDLTAEAPLDLNGPKYLLLYLDDFNHNRTNKGLISIEDRDSKLDLPKYYKEGNIQSTNGGVVVIPPQCQNDTLEINNCPPETLPVKTPFYTQDLPRTITQAQQYSINEIIKNRKNTPNLKITPPNPNNIFGVIPAKIQNLNFGEVLVENANSLTYNTRRYFGPVDIERIEVKLLDDKGNLVDLNGADWSFTLFSDHLYQY
jgi:hypothetical protein